MPQRDPTDQIAGEGDGHDASRPAGPVPPASNSWDIERVGYTALVVLLGAGTAVQLAMLGALRDQRGPSESAWISITGTAAGLALILIVRTLRGRRTRLASPVDQLWLQVGVAALLSVAFVLSMRGIDIELGLSGFIGLYAMIVLASLVPKIGVTLVMAASTAGSLGGALLLDDIGAFGIDEESISVLRVVGAALLLGGVALVQGD